MKSLCFIWFLVSMAWLVPSAQAQSEFTVIPLPDVSPGNRATGIDLNDLGQVLCGGVYQDGTTRSFIFDDGVLTDLGLPEGATVVAATAINNTGHVVGKVFDPQLGYRPFLWHQGQFSPLTATFFEGLNDITPVDVNDSLQVVGTHLVPEHNLLANRGWIWQGGVAEELGLLVNDPDELYPMLTPYAINNLGQIVGVATVAGPDDSHAFLWQAGALVDLGRLGGTGNTAAYDINDTGSIVGDYCYSFQPLQCHPQAFLRRDGSAIDIDPRGDEHGDWSQALAVNARDEVLVQRLWDLAGPYLWREGVLDDLHTLVELPPGVRLSLPIDINDRGDILCLTDAAGFFLLSRGGITRPSLGQLLVSGTEDAIQWQVPEDMGYLYIELNTHAEDEPDRYVPIGNAPPQVGQLFWTVPDSISTQCRIRVHSPGYPDTLYSGLFRMKPLMLTRLDEEGDYVPWTMGRDNWSQGNNDDAWWPESWWVGNPDFDYEDGVDPISGRPYPDFPLPESAAFATAPDSTFADWPLFVRTFGESQCYENVAAGTYNPLALWNWYCQRRGWKGSCSGMAYSSLMFFRDPEAMRNRFPDLGAYETLPDDQPAADEIRLIVNQLQGAQSGADQVALTRERVATMTPRDVVRILEEEFARDEPFVIAPLGLYNYESGGAHAVVPFKITTDHAGADSTWDIYTYDPNLRDEPSFVRVSKQSGETEWSWRTIVNDSFWRGTGIGLMIDLPADPEYGEFVQLIPFFNGGGGGAFAAKSERIVASQDFTVFTSALGSMALTASDRPGMAGHVDGQPVDDLLGVTPLYSKTSVIGPPNGYLITGDHIFATHTFAMGDGADAERVLGVFRGDASVCYLRAPGDSAATDRVSFVGGGMEIGVAAVGTPGAPKSITLTTIAQENDHKKVWMVSEIELAEGDSIRVDRVAWTEEIRILNAGPSPRTCTLGLERASADGNPQFLAAGIGIPAGASLQIAADWSNLAEAPVSIQVDLGNDGTVDEVIEVENELGEIPSDAPESLQAAAFGFHAHPLADGRGGVRIQGSIPVDCHVKLQVYDVLGRNIGTIFDGRHGAGELSLSWASGSGRDARPASGICFVRLEAVDNDGRVLYRGARKALIVR